MARWIEPGGPQPFAFIGAASRTLRGEPAIDCPACGAAKLRAYVHVFNVAKRTGETWVWCPACHTTAHVPRVTPAADGGPDPFAALEPDLDESFLDRLDRFVGDGTATRGTLRPSKRRDGS